LLGSLGWSTAARAIEYRGTLIQRERLERPSWTGPGKKVRRSRDSNPASFAFDVMGGEVHIEMKRDGRRWMQSFEVVSDKIFGKGERVIRYKRPAENSLVARDNRRELDRGSLWGLFGGHQDLQGGGTIRVAGDRVRWSNGGQAQLRLGFKKGPKVWDEHFEGLAEGATPIATAPAQWVPRHLAEARNTLRRAHDARVAVLADLADAMVQQQLGDIPVNHLPMFKYLQVQGGDNGPERVKYGSSATRIHFGNDRYRGTGVLVLDDLGKWRIKTLSVHDRSTGTLRGWDNPS
jgi:hypothetical protein